MICGLAFGQSGLGAVHGLAHPLGHLLGVPHGLSCAILLPYIMEWNLPVAADEFAVLGGMCGVGDGAGEIVLNSIDTDGVKRGFDLEMLDAVCRAVSVPVIASGGAGCAQDFVTLFRTLPGVDAGLAASIFHFGEVEIPALKELLAENGILVRR